MSIMREKGSNITASSFNPGFMADTNFSGGTGKERAEQIRKMMPERYSTLEQSSAAMAALITDSACTDKGGLYYDRSINSAKSSELSYSADIEEELWETSLKAVRRKNCSEKNSSRMDHELSWFRIEGIIHGCASKK